MADEQIFGLPPASWTVVLLCEAIGDAQQVHAQDADMTMRARDRRPALLLQLRNLELGLVGQDDLLDRLRTTFRLRLDARRRNITTRRQVATTTRDESTRAEQNPTPIISTAPEGQFTSPIQATNTTLTNIGAPDVGGRSITQTMGDVGSESHTTHGLFHHGGTTTTTEVEQSVDVEEYGDIVGLCTMCIETTTLVVWSRRCRHIPDSCRPCIAGWLRDQIGEGGAPTPLGQPVTKHPGQKGDQVSGIKCPADNCREVLDSEGVERYGRIAQLEALNQSLTRENAELRQELSYARVARTMLELRHTPRDITTAGVARETSGLLQQLEDSEEGGEETQHDSTDALSTVNRHNGDTHHDHSTNGDLLQTTGSAKQHDSTDALSALNSTAVTQSVNATAFAIIQAAVLSDQNFKTWKELHPLCQSIRPLFKDPTISADSQQVQADVKYPKLENF